MRGDFLIGSKAIKGHVIPGRVFDFDGRVTVKPSIGGDVVLPGFWQSQGEGEHNDTLYGWATIVGQLLRGSPDGKQYPIGGMYIEFENNGGAAVSTPTFDRSGGLDYYDSLSASVTRDYLRVPITASTLTSTDDELFPDGNLITFFAQTTGVVGVHGKTFSDSVSSRVYGGAIVSFPVAGDASQDIVHSRFNFTAAANQLVKLAGSQISLTWPLTLN